MILEAFSQPRDVNRQYSLVEEYRLFILKEKAIYHNLNMLRVQGNIYQGNFWAPVELKPEIQDKIKELRTVKQIAGCEIDEPQVPKNQKPPTYIKTNDFTWAFQQIVNTYGVPRYREVNPGLFTIATFPFLFGIMFGDIGHGALLTIFGAYLCLASESISRDKSSSFRALLPARYLVLM